MKLLGRLLLACSVAAFAQELPHQLLQHWYYDKSTPLNFKQLGVQDLHGVKVYDVVYSSPVDDRGPAVGPNGGKVTAYLVVPPGKGLFPAVIYGHWCMPGSDKENRTEFLDEAILLAHSGVLSLLPDHVNVHPGFVEDTSPLTENAGAVEVQQDVNLRRGADLLLSRNDVDPKRLAYVGHSCDATAGAFLSGIDKRFKAFVLMGGDLSDKVDETTKAFQDFRQKVGPAKFDAFATRYAWTAAAKYVSHASPATVFLQYGTDEPFLNADIAKRYFEVVSEPKQLKIYQAPHALNSEATSDRITFLAQQLSFKAPTAQPAGRGATVDAYRNFRVNVFDSAGNPAEHFHGVED